MGRNQIGYARRVDRWAGKSSRMVNRVGGEIFAKTAKTPPLQSALRGGHCGRPSVWGSATWPSNRDAVLGAQRGVYAECGAAL